MWFLDIIRSGNTWSSPLSKDVGGNFLLQIDPRSALMISVISDLLGASALEVEATIRIWNSSSLSKPRGSVLIILPESPRTLTGSARFS